MRLTCPRCRAQYQIAASAIPAGGREVECSACAHVWHEAGSPSEADAAHKAARPAAAPGQTPPEAPYDPTARPVLNKPLNESILSILREETARELQARDPGNPPAAPSEDHIRASDAAAETTPDAPPPPPEPTLKAPMIAPDDSATPTEKTPPAAETPPETRDWPEPAAPALPDAALLAATLTRPAPAPAAQEPHLLLRPDPAEQIERAPEPASPPLAPTMPEVKLPLPLPVSRRRAAGYASGFGLALMLALGLLAFYALEPRVAAEGKTGLFHELRQDLDRGRLWLHERVFGG